MSRVVHGKIYIYRYIYIYIAIDTVSWVSIEVLTGRCVVCGASSGCRVRWDIFIYMIKSWEW